MTLQEHIAKLVASGWTYTEIAARVGVDQSTVSRYAAGYVPKAVDAAAGIFALDARPRHE